MTLTAKEKELRRKGLGGSDIASVFGLEDAYMTPFELWDNKVNGWEKPLTPELQLYLEQASDFEPYIITQYCKRTNETVYQYGRTKFSKQFPFLLANTDGMIRGKRGILECKVCRYEMKNQFGEEWTDEIPLKYMLQVAHYVMIHDYDYADLAVMIGSISPQIYRYNRNRALEAEIVKRARHFWEEYVIPEKMPEPTTQDDLSRIYALEKGKSLEANKDIYKKVKQLEQISLMRLEAEKAEKELKQEIHLYMKDSEILTYEGEELVKRRSQERTTVSGETLKAYNRKIYEDLCKKTKFFTLKII